MIYIEETGQVLAVGGEDENGGLLDSCELLNLSEGNWKMLNSLNYRNKQLSLCKFVIESKTIHKLYVYAFHR
jgi:hypothetical protein